MNVVTKANLASYIDTIKNAKVREAVKACWLGENGGVFRGVNITLHPRAKFLLDSGCEINTEYLRFVPHVSNMRVGMMAHAPNKKMLLRDGEPLFRRATPVAVLSMLFPNVPIRDIRKEFIKDATRQILMRMALNLNKDQLEFVEHGSVRFAIKHKAAGIIAIDALTPEYADVATKMIKDNWAGRDMTIEVNIVGRVK